MVHWWLQLQVQTWRDVLSGERVAIRIRWPKGDSSGPPVVEMLEVLKVDKQSYC